MLSDLRVEIGPRKVFDLEKVATREAIDNSRDLKLALATKKLALTRHSMVQVNLQQYRPPGPPPQPRIIERTIEKTIEKSSMNEHKLTELIRQVISEQTKPDNKIEEVVANAVKAGLGGLVASIREQINNTQISKAENQQVASPIIDPAKLAELSKKPLQKIGEDIHTNNVQKTKKVNVSKDLSALADELS